MGCHHSSCNHTSIGRDDDEPVQSLEKLINKNNPPPKSLEELRTYGETLQTGDIVLMHCTHTFGKLAQLMTRNAWDHVAMIVRLDESEDITKHRIALIHKSPQPPSSTVSWSLPGSPGYGNVEIFEAMGGGVFAYPFVEHALARGKFVKYASVRRLRHKETGESLSPERRAKIEEFIREFWARSYEDGGVQGLSELARPILKGHPHMSRKAIKENEALDRVFCSELIAEAYQRAELLPEHNLNSNDVLPSHFAPKQCIDDYLNAETHGYALGEIEIFKAATTPLTQAINERRADLKARPPKQADNAPMALQVITDEHKGEKMKPQ